MTGRIQSWSVRKTFSVTGRLTRFLRTILCDRDFVTECLEGAGKGRSADASPSVPLPRFAGDTCLSGVTAGETALFFTREIT